MIALSTTLNPFILPHDCGFAPYRAELENYAALGFSVLDCICCNADTPNAPLQREDWQQFGADLAQASRALGITYVQCHTPFYNFTSSAGGPDPFTEMLVQRSLHLAAMLQAQWVVMHPATAFGRHDMLAASREENLRYFAPHVALAEKLGVGIAIENMADFPGQGYPRSYCATWEELQELCDALNSPNVGICWDFGHANLGYRDQASCLRALSSRVKAVHIHDNFGDTDAHLPPYFGTVNWAEAMQGLRQIGYAGVLDFEVKRIALHLPQQLRNAQWQYVHRAGQHLQQLFTANA